MVKCQFVGDENTVAGRIVRCPGEATVIMRPAGMSALLSLGREKPSVCDHHMQLMISAKVRATGREWQIDHFVNEPGRKSR